MNCHTFRKQLEDYLENRLDFAGRFAIERHARQCVHCNREMTTAKELGRMTRELDRVKAPADFESMVLKQITERKIRRRAPLFRRFSVFGFDIPAWQQYALAASFFVVLGLGIFYWPVSDATRSPQIDVLTSDIPVDSFNMGMAGENSAYVDTAPVLPGENTARTAADVRMEPIRSGFSVRFKTSDSDYGEYNAIGTDNLPMIVPLPNTLQMQVGPPSEEFFITNISH